MSGQFTWPPATRGVPATAPVQVVRAGAGPWAAPPAPATGGDRLPEGAFRAAVGDINASLDEQLVDAEGDLDRARAVIAERVRGWAAEQARAGRSLPPGGEHARLVEAVFDERFRLGALQPLLDDPDVEEIDINGPDTVWVHYAGGRKAPGPVVADSDEELAGKVRRWAGRAASVREFSNARPLLNVALSVGVRMAATVSVTTKTHVSIRKQRLMDITLDQLVQVGTIDQVLRMFLAAAVRARADILVTGGVSAGKTTFLRALCSEFDPAERIITLESERELYLDHLGRHSDVVSYEAREPNQEGIGAVTLTDLLPQVLRMNPDRILVGEVRHSEMLALLQAIDNGLEGSLTTLHANSGAEVFGRILTLCAYSPHHPEPAELFRLIGRAVDLVVHLRRDRTTGQRYVTEVIEVLEPAEGTEPAINRIFVPGPDGRAIPSGVTPTLAADLETCGFDRRWLADRQHHWQAAAPPKAAGS